MRFLCFLLIGAALVHGVRVTQEPDQLLEPSFVSESQIICTRDCDLPPVDCGYSGWSDWGPCWSLSSCGGPYFTNRTRVVVVPAVGYGTPCTSSALIESRECTQTEIDTLTKSTDFLSKCAVPCIQSAWVVKSPCDVSQAQCPPRALAPANARIEGRVYYSRSIVQNPAYGGAACGANEKFEICYFDCRYDCEWGPFQNNGCELPCRPPQMQPDGSPNRQRLSRKIQWFAVNGGAGCAGDSVKYEGPCQDMSNLPTCCPGCTDSPWGDWTPCSVTCGPGGTTKRTRVVTAPSTWYTNPQVCGDAMPVCGATSEVQECCQDPCPEDCKCSEWSQWSDCYATNDAFFQCGEGSKTRYRNCLQPVNGGATCPAEEETQSCFLAGCPAPCVVSDWTPYTPCDATCGVRISKTRTRTILTPPENGGSPCPELTDTRECPCTPCPEDCKLSPWSLWGPCDSPCGPGKRQRTRDILITPKNGGRGCDVTVQESDCVVNEDGGYFETDGAWTPANKPCDVNCKVSDWSSWGPCSKTCTSDEDSTFPGIQTRTRTVTVTAQYNGIQCPATIQQKWCATQCCPVDMQLSDWGEWSTCTVTCGGGWQIRRRSVVVYPRCGGKIDDGALEQKQACNVGCCQRQCVYYPYSNFSPCKAFDADTTLTVASLFAAKQFSSLVTLFNQAPDVTCPTKSGLQYRTREVRIDNPCSACVETFHYRPCSISCIQDCKMGNWTDWSNCDRQCGWGAMRRTRKIAVQPTIPGGTPCPCNEDVAPCYAGPCCEDCTLTPWNDWEPCTASCGGGTTTRRRFVNMTSELCPEMECVKAGLRETLPCNTQDCVVPCVMSDWSGWSTCSSSCGLGYQHRTRSIATYGDGRCDWDFEEQVCNEGPCPVPCTYTEYTEWTPCPVTCIPAGTSPETVYYQYRQKFKISGDSSCQAYETDKRACAPYPSECKQICLVSEWGDWSACSSEYGWGERRRERTVVQYPTGDEICPQLYEIDRCYNEPPPNDCVWSTWGDWSACSSSCRTATDVPTRRKERYLVGAPTWDNYTSGGADGASSVTANLTDCAKTGDKFMTEQCVVPFCPQDCVMSKWSKWGPCENPGVRYRTRHVVSLPAYGGTPCPLCLKEQDKCTLKVNNLPTGECEVGKCLLEVQKELEAKHESEPDAGFEEA